MNPINTPEIDFCVIKSPQITGLFSDLGNGSQRTSDESNTNFTSFDSQPTSQQNSRITFSSLQPKGLSCFNSQRLCNWQRSKEKLGKILSFCLKSISCIHSIALKLIYLKPLHILRQLVSLLSIVVTLIIFKNSHENSDLMFLPMFAIVSQIAYIIAQTGYFCYLHNRLSLVSCWKDELEALHAAGIFYSILSIICNASIYHLAYVILFESQQNYHMPIFYGYSLISILIFQISTDSCILHLLCPIILFSGLAILFVSFFLYSIGYSLYFLTVRKCVYANNETQSECVKKQKVLEILDKTGILFNRENFGIPTNTPICSICLEILQDNTEVIIPDCSDAHIFHKECMKDWLCKSNVCPMCRAAVIPSDLYENLTL